MTSAGDLAAQLRATLNALLNEVTPGSPSHRKRKKLQLELSTIQADLDALLARLDPVAQPTTFFDPSDPRLVGRFVALALVAQDRMPLAEPVRSYGSGVYAIYYKGAFSLYSPLSGTETPIYVGQAAPANPRAVSPSQQGAQLTTRLNDHRRSVSGVPSTLSLDDFEYRALVVQSGWETPAEDYLIDLFRPVWNKETNLVFGIGKHGDAAGTRDHPRSPWHTVHPGRGWADAQSGDSKTLSVIENEVSQHFSNHPPYRDVAAVLEEFFAHLRQA